jgi:hypothetical protein
MVGMALLPIGMDGPRPLSVVGHPRIALDQLSLDVAYDQAKAIEKEAKWRDDGGRSGQGRASGAEFQQWFSVVRHERTGTDRHN